LNLLNQLAPLCRQHGAKLNLVSHSEGNYMLMLAMAALAANPAAFAKLTSTPPFADQVLMVAADINNGALQSAQSSPDAGQGAPITQYANAVTVYWSGYDSLLPFSEEWLDYHNPSFPDRLGLYGPASSSLGTILQNVTGLDCSNVANESNPHIPWDISVHESYFYIPQILLDMTQTLGDTAPVNVTNRVSTGNQSFQMTLVSPRSRTPHRPRNTRLARKAPGSVRP
jgi:esterase/lipase superfamily enzyme